MIDRRFTLITPGLPDVIIDEPMGYADIVQGMIRDDNWHGVYFQATINELGFYGEAALYLEDQKAVKGLRAEVIFLAEQRCKAADPWLEELRGRLNFGRFKSQCGLLCTVTMPVEQEGCVMTFRNRYDQSVDMDSLVAFDRLTGLQDYAGLNTNMTLKAQELAAGVIGDVGPDGDRFQMTNIPAGQGVDVRPIFNNVVDQSINIGNLAEPTNQYGTFGTFRVPTTPVLLLDEDRRCLPGTFDMDIRIKGTYSIVMSGGGSSITIIGAAIYEMGPDGDDDDAVVFAKQTYPSGGTSKAGSFDISYVNPAVTLRSGYGVYTTIQFNYVSVGPRPTIEVIWAPETHVSIKAVKACPPTTSDVYLINEVMSRTAEAITNNCIKVKSDYYGRTDSQPYTSGVDGCGSLRVLTHGLHLRQATENNKFFLSFQQIYDNVIRPIDNCGMGFEPNPELPGFEWLRIEPIDYFYQDFEVLRFPYVPQVNTEVDEGKHYSIIKVGYTQWEPKAIRGLNEFNSTREFRTSLETVKNQLEITSNFIASGSVIETVRRESFAETGKADTAYDNETFIICVDREVYGYKVEQGEIVGAANIFSPATVYNFRITPLRNLMRWFKSTINSYANILDSSAKLFFSKGTGNYTATGQLIDDCADENGPKAENIDLAITDFKNPLDAVPLVKPENVTFRYPFTASDFSKLRANRNGFVSVQCGNGSWLKVYITELQWEVRKGEAEIKGKIKWQ